MTLQEGNFPSRQMVLVTMGFLLICTLQALGFPDIVMLRFQRDNNGSQSSGRHEIEENIQAVWKLTRASALNGSMLTG